MKTLTRTVMVFLAAVLLAGCGSVISKGALQSISREVTVDKVQKEPDRYAGAKVLWGGVILGTKNLEQTTEIEVLETELDYNDLPEFTDAASKGRFIIEADRYLDSNIYKEGKGITVAGKVEGVARRKIGLMEYPYPVVRPMEMKLSEELPQDYYGGYPYGGYPYYDPFYSPFGPSSPYYPFSPFGPTYPFGPYPYRRHPFYPYP
ncbi:MAG: Slp family lipoprotein [Deltaproteobacteria bacterium]|nr:Slp family lipoprotein [Deltaproteobacteria bacterium]